jgi:hypothetical protein
MNHNEKGADSFSAYVNADNLSDSAKEYVSHLTTALPEEVLQTSHWQDLDKDWQEKTATGLFYIALMELETPSADDLTLLSPESQAAVETDLAAFHRTLPFSEPERSWLADNYADQFDRINEDPENDNTDARDHVLTLLATAPPTDAQINGVDLIQKWWDWRRSAGNHSKGHAHSQAADALTRLQHAIDRHSMTNFGPLLPKSGESSHTPEAHNRGE